MKIITVTGFKGGVGKSTTAIHIAGYFSGLGQTLLVDGDPNHTAVSWANRGHLPFPVVTSQQSLKAVAGKDWVIFDTPARPNSDDLQELIGGCDLLILPTSPDIGINVGAVEKIQPGFQTNIDQPSRLFDA